MQGASYPFENTKSCPVAGRQGLVSRNKNFCGTQLPEPTKKIIQKE